MLIFSIQECHIARQLYLKVYEFSWATRSVYRIELCRTLFCVGTTFRRLVSFSIKGGVHKWRYSIFQNFWPFPNPRHAKWAKYLYGPSRFAWPPLPLEHYVTCERPQILFLLYQTNCLIWVRIQWSLHVLLGWWWTVTFGRIRKCFDRNVFSTSTIKSTFRWSTIHSEQENGDAWEKWWPDRVYFCSLQHFYRILHFLFRTVIRCHQINQLTALRPA